MFRIYVNLILELLGIFIALIPVIFSLDIKWAWLCIPLGVIIFCIEWRGKNV